MSRFGIVTDAATDTVEGSSTEGGGRQRLLAGLLAFVLASSAVGLYYFLNRPQPAARLTVESLRFVPRHVTTPTVDANGDAMASQSVDQMLVFAKVRIENPANHPVVLKDLLLDRSEAGGVVSVSAASRTQFAQAAVIYPELAELKAAALPTTGDIEAGQSVEGMLFWALRQSPAQWSQHSPLSLTAQFQYQPSVRIPLEATPAAAH